MIKAVKMFLLWQFKFLLSLYGPTILIFIFAMLREHFFPGSPLWPVGLFTILMIVVFTRYCKW